MSNDVQIKVGAKVDSSSIQKEAEKIEDIFAHVMKALESSTDASASEIIEKLGKIKESLNAKGEAGAYAKKVQELLSALVKNADAAEDSAVKLDDVTKALSAASEATKDFKNNVEEANETLEDESVGNFVDSLDKIDEGLARITRALREMGETAKKTFAFIQAHTAMALAAASAVVVSKAIATRNEMNKILYEKNERTFAEGIQKENREYERQNSILERTVSLRKTLRDNLYASLSATRSLIIASGEYELAKAKVGARTSYETEEIENNLIERKNKQSALENMQQIIASKDDDKEDLAKKKIELLILKKQQKTTSAEVARYAQRETAHYEHSSENLNAGGSLSKVWNAQLRELWNKYGKGTLSGDYAASLSPEEHQEKFLSYRDKRIASEEKLRDELSRSAVLLKEIEALENKLNGDYYKNRENAAKLAEEQAKEELNARKDLQDYERRNAEIARNNTLRDRENQLKDAEMEANISFHEGVGGYNGKKVAIQRRRELIDEQVARERRNFEIFEDEEAKRLNVDTEGLKNKKPYELSQRYRDALARMEEAEHSAEEKRTSLKWEEKRMEREGDERTAELMARTRKGGSRLTALGIGGGDSPQRETAKNTRSLARDSREIVKLLHSAKTPMRGLTSRKTLWGSK
jgi:hypothetical protein